MTTLLTNLADIKLLVKLAAVDLYPSSLMYLVTGKPGYLVRQQLKDEYIRQYKLEKEVLHGRY